MLFFASSNMQNSLYKSSSIIFFSAKELQYQPYTVTGAGLYAVQCNKRIKNKEHFNSEIISWL